MSDTTKATSPEVWNEEEIGNDEQFVQKVSAVDQKEIDDALGLQAISIRLPKELIEQFKVLAKIHGMGYQPLMREALKRFALHETKVIMTQLANDGKKETLENGKQKLEVELSLDQRHAA